MQVQDLMTTEVACCGPDSSLEEVAGLMAEFDCGEIPVLDADDKPIGVITDRDITIRAVAEGKNPLELKAKDCMTSPCITCRGDADLEECFRQMEDNQIRRMIVVDSSGRCVGIVAQADIALQASAQDCAEIVREVSQPNSGSHATF